MKYDNAPPTFIQSVAYLMESSGKYKISIQESTGFYIITKVPKKSAEIDTGGYL